MTFSPHRTPGDPDDADGRPFSDPGRRLLFFRTSLALALMAITFLATTRLSVPVVEDLNDKFNHLLAFITLGFLTDKAFPEAPGFLARALPLFAYGVLIECFQHFIPGRMFSLPDMAADGAGLLVYEAGINLWGRMRSKVEGGAA